MCSSLCEEHATIQVLVKEVLKDSVCLNFITRCTFLLEYMMANGCDCLRLTYPKVCLGYLG